MSKAKIPLTFIAVFTAVLLSACTITGPGSVVTEEKDLTDFTYVDVEGTFDIEIVQSDSFSITISAGASVSTVNNATICKVLLTSEGPFESSRLIVSLGTTIPPSSPIAEGTAPNTI